MRKQLKSSGDVIWYLPNEKNAFAESTVSTSDLITVLSEIYQTTKEVYLAINYDDEAKKIVKHFIDKGYGNYIFSDFVHINPNLTYRKLENGKIKSISIGDLKNHLDLPISNEDYDYDY